MSNVMAAIPVERVSADRALAGIRSVDLAQAGLRCRAHEVHGRAEGGSSTLRPAAVKKTISREPDHGSQGVAMIRPSSSRTPLCAIAAAGVIAILPAGPGLHAATPADLSSGYAVQAGSAAMPARGQALFTVRHGREWSCASCHGADPTQPGRHAATGKPIAALAPAFNPQRFTDPAKVEKWFRRNCGDVFGRECTAAEKADVMSWLITLKP
jgi:hypothetical protein